MFELTVMNHIGIYLILSIIICFSSFLDDDLNHINRLFLLLYSLIASLFLYVIFEALYWIVYIFFINAQNNGYLVVFFARISVLPNLRRHNSGYLSNLVAAKADGCIRLDARGRGKLDKDLE